MIKKNQIIVCKICDRGELRKKRAYRFSLPVVIIGYIFLVPCLLGVFSAGRTLFGSAAVTLDIPEQTKNRITAELRTVDLSDDIIAQIFDYHLIELSDLGQLNEKQQAAVNRAEAAVALILQGKMLASTFSVAGIFFFMIISFIGGIIGWLLVMKKKLLQCSICGACIERS